MGVGQELTNGLEGVGHAFSFMLKQKKSPPPPHINNDRSLNENWLISLSRKISFSLSCVVPEPIYGYPPGETYGERDEKRGETGSDCCIRKLHLGQNEWKT